MQLPRISSKFLYGLVLCCLTFLASCDKDDSTPSLTATDAESQSLTGADLIAYRSDTTVYGMQRGGSLGRLGCYDLVFPVGVHLPDSTAVDVADYAGLLLIVSDWLTANPGAEGRPSFVFPISVTNEDGEVLTVISEAEFHELRHVCPGSFDRRRGGHDRGGSGGGCSSCYTIVFPLTVSFPDGATAEAADRKTLQELTRAWRQANPEAGDKPTLVFPYEVQLSDGTTVSVTSTEDLQSLREECKSEADE